MEDIEDVFVKNPDTGEDILVTSVKKYFYDMDSEEMDKCKLCGFVIPQEHLKCLDQGFHLLQNHLMETKPLPSSVDKLLKVMSGPKYSHYWQDGKRFHISTMKTKDRQLLNDWKKGRHPFDSVICDTTMKYFKKDKCKLCGFVVQKVALLRDEWDSFAMKHMDEKHKDSPYVMLEDHMDHDGTVSELGDDFGRAEKYFFNTRWRPGDWICSKCSHNADSHNEFSECTVIWQPKNTRKQAEYKLDRYWDAKNHLMNYPNGYGLPEEKEGTFKSNLR